MPEESAREQSTTSQGAFEDWLTCPECGSSDVSQTFHNGRLAYRCRDCRHTINRLVGGSTFR